MLEIMKKNWKTTTSGLAAMIPAACSAFHWLTPDQAMIAMGAVVLLIGLFAQDGNKANE